MNIKQLLAFYFNPLSSYADHSTTYSKDGLLQLPLWFLRKREIENAKIPKQFKQSPIDESPIQKICLSNYP